MTTKKNQKTQNNQKMQKNMDSENRKHTSKPRMNPALKALLVEKTRLDKKVNLSENRTRMLRRELYKVIVAIRAMESTTDESYGHDLFRDILTFIEYETKSVDAIYGHLSLLNKRLARSAIRELIKRMSSENLISTVGHGITITDSGRAFLRGENVENSLSTKTT